MRKFMIFSGTVTLATIWMVAPAVAQTTTTDKVENKMERAKDKAEDKAERAADKAESKTEKLKDKAVETKDKIKEKAVEAKDKIKEKTGQAKDKLEGKKDQLEAKGERNDVRAAQQALRDKGFDPGPIDGIHGPRTSAAVRNYQKAEGLTATGRLDEQTRDRLNVHASATTTDKAPSASPATDAKAPAQKRQSP
jgi:peptidoglycan hydrolase-like protein with peptidoglycan-binding domain